MPAQAVVANKKIGVAGIRWLIMVILGSGSGERIARLGGREKGEGSGEQGAGPAVNGSVFDA
jgi:hypothetical protein